MEFGVVGCGLRVVGCGVRVVQLDVHGRSPNSGRWLRGCAPKAQLAQRFTSSFNWKVGKRFFYFFQKRNSCAQRALGHRGDEREMGRYLPESGVGFSLC